MTAQTDFTRGLLAALLLLLGVGASCTTRPPAVASAPPRASAEIVKLGRQLFEEVILSRDSTISCATCHAPSGGFAEPRAVSHGLGVLARARNTPSLINVRHNGPFDWDGRASDLRHQLHGVFSPTGDMGLDLGDAVERLHNVRRYRAMFLEVFHRPPDVDGLLDALVAFEESIVAGDTRFERFYLRGDSSALSEQELRGWLVFLSPVSGCAGCHVPTSLDERGRVRLWFKDNDFHNLGVGYAAGRITDVGRFAVTRTSHAWGAFKTPTLINISQTAPYMHDGSLANLSDVVAFYTRGGIPNPNIDPIIKPRRLTNQQQADLVAFLESLAIVGTESRPASR